MTLPLAVNKTLEWFPSLLDRFYGDSAIIIIMMMMMIIMGS